MIMKRVLLDTNIYGEMVQDPELDTLVASILKEKQLIIYGNVIIKRELRETSKEELLDGSKNLRVLLVSASMKGLNIVVSEDDSSMLRENAIRAYKLINSIIKKETPSFTGYEEFKAQLKSRGS